MRCVLLDACTFACMLLLLEAFCSHVVEAHVSRLLGLSSALASHTADDLSILCTVCICCLAVACCLSHAALMLRCMFLCLRCLCSQLNVVENMEEDARWVCLTTYQPFLLTPTNHQPCRPYVLLTTTLQTHQHCIVTWTFLLSFNRQPLLG
jgi:hypothetical protein